MGALTCEPTYPHFEEPAEELNCKVDHTVFNHPLNLPSILFTACYNMKIQTILDQIDIGSMALPEFQRGFVWNRDQVRNLMYSLDRKHPIGSLLGVGDR